MSQIGKYKIAGLNNRWRNRPEILFPVFPKWFRISLVDMNAYFCGKNTLKTRTFVHYAVYTEKLRW